MDESWSEENNEGFKLNDTNDAALNVSFENDFQFVLDKRADDKNTNCEAKDSNLSFLISVAVQIQIKVIKFRK